MTSLGVNLPVPSTHDEKTVRMKKTLPLIFIIASAILIIGNFIVSEKYDPGFWVSNLSSLLVIIAMGLTIRAHKKNKTESKYL